MSAINFSQQRKPSKQALVCKLLVNNNISGEIYRLDFAWPGPAPRAGQFFMIMPERTSVFLGRPISVAAYNQKAKTVKFLIAIIGKGTVCITDMRPGEYAQLSGPLGNAWADFIKPADADKPIALVGGSLGVAPLQGLYEEFPARKFDFYAGFKNGFSNDKEKLAILGPAAESYPASARGKTVIATEDGSDGEKGLITDFLDTKKYSGVCACGPQSMLQVIAEKCRSAGTPCYLSLERSMACGVGACLGCTVKTAQGNRRCCADGPVFKAEDVVDE